MSNTGQNKKLATFNCDEKLWGKFLHRCQEQGTTATATLTQFISLYLEGKLENFDGISGKHNIDEQIQSCVSEYLEEHLPAYIDNYLTNLQSKDLTTAKTKGTPNSQKTKLPQKPLFWTIKARAKHLGLTVNASQILHVEMYQDLRRHTIDSVMEVCVASDARIRSSLKNNLFKSQTSCIRMDGN